MALPNPMRAGHINADSLRDKQDLHEPLLEIEYQQFPPQLTYTANRQR